MAISSATKLTVFSVWRCKAGQLYTLHYVYTKRPDIYELENQTTKASKRYTPAQLCNMIDEGKLTEVWE